MAKLIIHAGMGKTGTSSIQVSLLKNKDALAQQGIVYLESNQSKPDLSAKHRLKWRNYKSEQWKDLRREAAKLAKTDKTVILSNETLWKKNEQEQKLLKKIFRKFDVTILIYVREQVEFLESRTLQAMKRDRNALKLDFSDPENPTGLEKFLEKFAPYLDYLKVARLWERVFGKGSVQARLYARDVFPDGNVVGDFYDAIGAEKENLDLSTEMNPSLSVPFAAITTERRRYLPDIESKSEVLDAALRLSKIRKTNLPRLISPERAEKIRSEVAESNKTFFEEFVVNADEFKVRDWTRGDTCNFEELANEMREIILSWPLVGFKSFGPSKLSSGIYKKGWALEDATSRCQATQTEDPATIRFRIHTRAKLRLGGSDLKLQLVCCEESAVRKISVNEEEIGEFDLARNPIEIPASALGEYDNIEVTISGTSEASGPLTITNVLLKDETTE